MPAKLFVLDGPAAAGKTHLARRLLADERFSLKFCPRVTSRPPEADDEEYDYVSPDEFEQMVNSGEFASYRVFLRGYSYGVPRKPVEEILASGENALAIVDLGTGEQIKETWPEAVTIFLISPAEEIEQRLKEIGDTPSEVSEKVQNAVNSYSFCPYYDYIIPNRQGQVEAAYQQLSDILAKNLSS